MPAKTKTTFLMLMLAQTHLAHAASHFKRAPPHRRPRAVPTVAFHAPSASSTYAPAASVNVAWTSDTEVVSPSFRLCLVGTSAPGKRHSNKDEDEKESDSDEKNKDDTSSGDTKSDDGGDGSCGAAVWATVKNEGGEYSIEVTAPAVDTPTKFYLEMRDDFDNGMRTNIFTIADGGGAVTQDVGGQAPMQAGGSSADTTGSSTATGTSASTNGSPSIPNADSGTGVSSSNAGHSSTGNAGGLVSNTNSSSPYAGTIPSSQTGATGGSPNTSVPNLPPNNYPPYIYPSTPALLATRSPPPVAAFAVPLSIVGAILLIAALALYRRRKDDKIKGEGLQNIGAHQNDTENGPGAYPFATGGDMQGLPMNMTGGMYTGMPTAGMGVMPVPLYMPREVTRDAGYHRSQNRLERDGSYRPHSRDTYRSRSRDQYYSRRPRSSVTGDVLFDYLATPSGDRVFTPPSAHVRRSAQTRMDTKEVFGRVGEKLKGPGGGGLRCEYQ